MGKRKHAHLAPAQHDASQPRPAGSQRR